MNVSNTAPTSGQVLGFDGTEYVPTNVSATSVAWTAITGIPADIADGDADTDTQLNEAAVDAFVANNGYLTSYTETDPGVQAFAKTSLPTCGAGEVLKSNGTTLSCVTDVDTDTNTTYSDATTSVAGLLSATDKTKLDTLDRSSLDAADGAPLNALVIDNDGNVGIGTASPGQALDVNGLVRYSTTGFHYQEFLSDHVAFTKKSGTHSFFFRKSDDGTLSGSNVTDLMTIQNDGDVIIHQGNIGIGTASPAAKLDIGLVFGNTGTFNGTPDGNGVTCVYSSGALLDCTAPAGYVFLQAGGYCLGADHFRESSPISKTVWRITCNNGAADVNTVGAFRYLLAPMN